MAKVQLRTGKLRPASQSDCITKLASVGPSEKVDCPIWLAFLNQATRDDKELVAFLKRWFGYCLTGDTREHKLVFAWGPGGNGKGVLMNTISTIFGDYCTTAAMDSFVVTRSDKHTTDMAMLARARLVMTTEVEEGHTWAQAKVNQLTGGDPITARFMRRDNFTYIPQFKLSISGNNKLRLNNVDDAARRRINMVPFVNKPTKPDGQLAMLDGGPPKGPVLQGKAIKVIDEIVRLRQRLQGGSARRAGGDRPRAQGVALMTPPHVIGVAPVNTRPQGGLEERFRLRMDRAPADCLHCQVMNSALSLYMTWTFSNTGKTPGSRGYQAGCPRQWTSSDSGGTTMCPGTLSRLPR
jgi:hypothetical protein